MGLKISRRAMLLGTGASVAVLAIPGCISLPQLVANAVLPDAPPYPFEDPARVRAQAQQISDRLEAFIADWLDGSGPAELPAALIPPGADPLPTNLRLLRAEDIDPADQWSIRPAHEIDWNDSPGLYPDPHCTYLIAVPVFVPFGTTIEIDGSFPYARFFDIQVTPPFDPRYYYYGTAFGASEVPMVDADIEPLRGHSNPFRLGSNRRATRRSYHVELDMVMGAACGISVRSGSAIMPPMPGAGRSPGCLCPG